MPSRISLPKLSLFPSRHSSTPSTAESKMRPPPPPPTSIPRRASTLSPASPPARLHLRNILPASPEEPPIMPPPPRTPRAWVWQCHQCHSVYRLGCTRRCLDCSHTYCVVSSKQSSSNRGKKRRRQQGALCGAEFDYIGWEQWGSWKRKVQGYESTGRCDTAARDSAFMARKHNCWIDCDSPSECGHRRYELAAEMLRNRMFVPDEADSEAGEKQSPVIVADASPKSPDDDISLTEALVLSEVADGEDEAPPKSPLQSSFLLDDDDDDEEEEEEEEDGEMKKTRKQEDDEEEERWWAARTGDEVDDDDDSGGAKILTVRNFTESDMMDDSDSSSESGESRWSSSSSTLTDDSCPGAEAGTVIKAF
ncbi:hypothetical protein F4803DRAFT_439091 [Xylaria telfairii]|nr:hypothetical protein F4803DRAFT_439091 [Xylaria telfairii]